ncbi:lasso peptide biosynthesis PqqD family chaperone [Nonomuraea sp. NPDC002799]
MRLNAEVSTADTEYGMILLHERSGRYWQLNETGALIVRTLLDGGSAEQAVRRLTEHYAVGPSQAEQDVQTLVAGLAAAGVTDR